MPPNIPAWRIVVEQVVRGIADEALQRRAWFGFGPEISSPGEEFNQLLGDAALEDFLKWDGTGLNDLQIDAGTHLLNLMQTLSKQTPDFIDPSDLIDDPRWQEIRAAAARFSALLSIK